MKKDGDPNLSGTKLACPCTYMSVLSIGAHRALPDVMAMERILTHASLASCLAELPIRSANTQRRLWEKQKRLFPHQIPG